MYERKKERGKESWWFCWLCACFTKETASSIYRTPLSFLGSHIHGLVTPVCTLDDITFYPKACGKFGVAA